MLGGDGGFLSAKIKLGGKDWGFLWQEFGDLWQLVCIEKKLIVELDGSQHLEQEEYDEERTKYLNSLGYKVIRFWNKDVMKNVDGVILTIIQAMEDVANKD